VFGFKRNWIGKILLVRPGKVLKIKFFMKVKSIVITTKVNAMRTKIIYYWSKII